MNALSKLAGTSRRPLAAGCALLIGLAAPSRAQYTGEFSAANLGTGDSDALVGLRADKDYLYAVNLGSSASLTINGVNFTGFPGPDPTSPGQWTLTGVPNVFPTGGINPGGVLGQLTDAFVYNGNTETVSIDGLTTGESYVITFYNRSWEAAGGRRMTTTASGASSFAAGFTYDQDIGATGQGSLNVLRYTFQAASQLQVLNFIAQLAGTTMHQYGFTVERTFNNTWTGGTDWTTATWSGAAPLAAGYSASFAAQAAPTEINLDANVTVGHVQLDGANPWTLSSANGSTLTLQADIGGVSNVSAKGGTHTIATDITLANNLLKTGGGALALTGNVGGNASIHLTGGTLRLTGTNSYTGENVIAGGAVLEVTSVSDYGVPSAIGARTFAMENNSVTGIGLHFQGGTLRFVGSTPQSTNRQIRMLTGTGATIDASGTTPEATLSFTHSAPNINLFDTGGTRTLTLTGTNTGANTFAIQLTNQATSTTSINKAGAGTWHLTNNASSYTGLTQISGGVLNVSSLSDYGVPSAIGARTDAQEVATGNGIGIWFGPNVSTGTLQYTGATSQSTNRQIRVGTGGATFDASGSLPSATMSFTYSGANTNLYDTQGARTVTLTGTNTGANVFAIQLTDQNIATGRTSVNKRGAGTWHLTNTGSTYGGVTAIEGGILNVASLSDYDMPSALGSRAAGADVSQNIGLLFRGGTLQYTGSTPQSTNRAIRVSTDGGATIDASGSTAAATLSFTASFSPDFFENAGNRSLTLTGTNSGRNIFGMAIAEVGGQTSLTKNGAGMWVLTGASTYTGATTINAGTLRVNGTLGNTAVAVQGGGALGGTGSIAGPVAVFSGGRLAAGDSVGTLTLSSLSLAPGSVLDFEFNPTADLVAITTPGGLAINGGGINLYAEGTSSPWTTNGTYTLFDYDTSYIGTIANLSLLNSQAGKFYLVTDDTAATTIRITISDAALSEWNTAAGGQWTAGANWTGGIPNAQGAVAKFGAAATAASNVTVNGPKTAGGILFDNANRYTITGGAGDTITLDNGFAAGSLTVLNGSHTLAAPIAVSRNLSASVASGSTLVIVGNLSGPGSDLLVSGPGTVILAGTNDYAATTVNSGTLQVGMSGNTGTLGSGPVNLAAGATLHFDRSDSFTVANNLLGPAASLSTSGSGTVTLTGANTIGSLGEGLVNVLAGTLALGSAGALPANVSLAVTGGTVDLNGNDVSVKNLVLSAGAITDTSTIAGTTALELNASGTTTITGSIASGPTRTLAVNLNTGTLQIGDGGVEGSLTATSLKLGAGAILNLNRLDDFALPTNITGSVGVVNQNGLGVVTFSGTNTFPVLNVNAGTVKIGSATAFSAATVVNLNTGTFDLNERNVTIGGLTGSGFITDGGAAATVSTLTIDQAVNTTFSGTIMDGAGQSVALTKRGTGTMTLAGNSANTYAGLTTVTGGTLHLQQSGTVAIAGDILVGDAAGSDVLQLGAHDQIADTSVLTFTAGGSGNSAFFRLNSFNETVRGIQTTVGQAAVIENNGPADTLSTLTVNTADADFTYDGILRNASVGTSVFALTKIGEGTLTLANSASVAHNSYTGATTIEQGKLVLQDLGGFASPIFANSSAPDTLTINQATRDLRINAPIGGSGAIIKNGPAVFTMGGANSMSGTITLNDGILGLANAGALGNATVVLNGGNIRAVDAGRTVFNPVIVNGSFTLGRLTDLLGPIFLNANATITADNPDGPANFNSSLGPIGGGFQISFADGVQGLGSGALIVSAINTNTGGTSVMSGRVIVAASGALADAPLVVDGGELIFSNSAQTVTSLSGSGGLISMGTNLTVNQSTDTVFSGVLVGGGGLTKVGPGLLNLTGASFSFSGPIRIEEGTLAINGSVTGNSTVTTGGVLGGAGFVGAVESTAGIIAPGMGVGTLTAGSLQLDGSSTWRFELATPGIVGSGVNDLLQINGALLLDGTLEVVPLGAFGGGTYRLAQYTGVFTDNGLILDPDFLQLYPGSSIDTSVAGEVNLIVVPEPGSAALLLGGLCALVGSRRTRNFRSTRP